MPIDARINTSHNIGLCQALRIFCYRRWKLIEDNKLALLRRDLHKDIVEISGLVDVLRNWKQVTIFTSNQAALLHQFRCSSYGAL